MFKTKKNQKTLFLIIKGILVILVTYILYVQISQFDTSNWESLRIENPVAFLFAFVFAFPNLWLAYRKWRVILYYGEIESSIVLRIQSFFAGLITGLLTPNMIGNFIGRLYYFSKEHRSAIIGLTLIGNFAQFLVSLIFGLISVSILSKLLIIPGYDIGLVGLLIMLFGLIAYFFIELFLPVLGKEIATQIRLGLRSSRIVRIRLLLLSAARFVIFTFQFALFLYAFGIELNWILVMGIWQVYLITIITPSIFLGKLGVKESISIAVLGSLGINEYAVLFASLIVWFINTLFPVLLGLVICKRKGQLE